MYHQDFLLQTLCVRFKRKEHSFGSGSCSLPETYRQSYVLLYYFVPGQILHIFYFYHLLAAHCIYMIVCWWPHLCLSWFGMWQWQGHASDLYRDVSRVAAILWCGSAYCGIRSKCERRLRPEGQTRCLQLHRMKLSSFPCRRIEELDCRVFSRRFLWREWKEPLQVTCNKKTVALGTLGRLLGSSCFFIYRGALWWRWFDGPLSWR